MVESNIENAFSMLAETRDLARSNLVRALSNSIAALIILALLFFADRYFINVSHFTQSISETTVNILWVSNLIIALGSFLYAFWALGHAYISWGHLREANDLWRKVNHG